MGISINEGTPKSSILVGFFLINHPFWSTSNGTPPPYIRIYIYIIYINWIKLDTHSSLPSDNTTVFLHVKRTANHPQTGHG